VIICRDPLINYRSLPSSAADYRIPDGRPAVKRPECQLFAKDCLETKLLVSGRTTSVHGSVRPTTGRRRPRVAFIGVDGVPYSLLSENEELFPNFAAIADDGTAEEISSIVPPESSACWPSLTTGVNPGETGVYGFQDREVGTYDTYVPMGRDVQADRIWDRVQENGRKATVMNVPVTFPPQRDVQRMVSGFLSPGLDKAAYPDDVRDYLETLDYRIDVNPKLGHQDDKSEFIEDAHATVDAQYEAFQHYIEEDDWDLFFGVFMTTDRVNHFLFKDYERDGEYRDEFIEFYRKVDDYIGRLRDSLPEDVTLIVASDHGFTSLDYEVHFNESGSGGGLALLRNRRARRVGRHRRRRESVLVHPRAFLHQPRGPRTARLRSRIRVRRGSRRTQSRPRGARGAKRQQGGRPRRREGGSLPRRSRRHRTDLVAIPNNGFDLKSGFKADSEIFTTGPRNGMHSFDDTSLYIDSPDATIEDADLFDITPTILDLMEIEYSRGDFDGTSLA